MLHDHCRALWTSRRNVRYLILLKKKLNLRAGIFAIPVDWIGCRTL